MKPTPVSITFSRVMNSFNYYILMRCNDARMTCWKFIPTRNGERPSWLLQFWVFIYSWAKIIWRSEAKRHQIFVEIGWFLQPSLQLFISMRHFPYFHWLLSTWCGFEILTEFQTNSKYLLYCRAMTFYLFLKRKGDTYFQVPESNLKLIWKKVAKSSLKIEN